MIPIGASKKWNEKEVFSNLQDKREERKPKKKIGQLVRTADIKKEFLVNEVQQIGLICYTQKLKSFMILFFHVELTLYPRDIMKIYIDQQK